MQNRTTSSYLEKDEFAGQSPSFTEGIKDSFPIAVGYIPIALTYGLTAKSVGIPDYITILMSVIVFAGASQFVGVKLMSMGATSWEIVLTTFILNFRHFLMSSSLSRKIKSGIPKKWLGLIAFGVTDESFSVASMKKEEALDKKYFLGLNFFGYASWVGGTCAGVFLAAGLPPEIKTSMGIALYAMFIGLLVPAFRDSRQVILISMLAVLINSIIYWHPVFSFISEGWGIIIATVVAAGAGAVIYPGGVKN